MINFRYHVVSLTAVFLALAIGLVVGTAALNGPVADSLEGQVTGLRKDNQNWRQTVSNMEKQLGMEEKFAEEMSQVVLPGTLTGRRVVVLSLPNGRDHTEGVLKKLQLGGATITGRVDLQDKFINPDNNSNLLELAVTAARPTAQTTGLPGNGHGVETSSALLASVLLDRTQGTAPVSDADRRAVLAAYNNAGYLTTDSNKVTGSAEAVVVVSGQPYVDKDSEKRDESVVKIAEQFDRTGSIVVAGNGSVGGNLVSVVRGDPVLAQTISTVDNANTGQGQLVTSLALVQQLTEKKAGQYGVGDNAASLLPRLPQ
ncbi:copper transporter [Micromonospora zamorensis]|uniref:Copper transporter n=1 Tax=Micromonospora zamorensis TaxID=709883 RepID=A0ABZ1PP46_9ACTN|nr:MULTISPECIES: copper transporter [Micromonospora]MBQ0981994.1 copper transporter [Micromonospora sp. M61]MBQ1040630.1 copper transporter [Micromonospora sp. C81]WSK47993.1 copper transporter [Micromonospora zamorensis]WTE89302.1 copper transporter [Micromonospora zamorensis]WTI24076.1 copper transporter [Micromonospora zamorensis]